MDTKTDLFRARDYLDTPERMLAYVDKLHAEIDRLRTLLKPFSDMAGELFARNWNNGDVVIALDNPDDPHRLTARDFFAVRITLNG